MYNDGMFWDFLFRKKKRAVIIHGYPAPENEAAPIWRCLEELGYKVVSPQFLEGKERFSVEWIENEIERLLGGKKPDVLAGISMGGLILPQIAKKYPNAKLLFIATGARLGCKTGTFNWAIKAAASRNGDRMIRALLKVPDSVLGKGYEMINKESHGRDKIVKAIRNLAPEKHSEVARFVLEANNWELARGLKNKALVISGRRDVLMPPEAGRELAEAIPNCRHYITDAEHFNILNHESLDEIKIFLK